MKNLKLKSARAALDLSQQQLAEKEGVTEQLKANNQMLWVRNMNNIRNRVTEIVNSELIYN